MSKRERYEQELAALTRRISWRWGETRRFYTNHHKLARRNWLIVHIAEERAKEKET